MIWANENLEIYKSNSANQNDLIHSLNFKLNQLESECSTLSFKYEEKVKEFDHLDEKYWWKKRINNQNIYDLESELEKYKMLYDVAE